MTVAELVGSVAVTVNAESVLMVVVDTLVISIVTVGLVDCTFGSSVTKAVLVVVDGAGESKLFVLVGELSVIVDWKLIVVRSGGWTP